MEKIVSEALNILIKRGERILASVIEGTPANSYGELFDGCESPEDVIGVCKDLVRQGF